MIIDEFAFYKYHKIIDSFASITSSKWFWMLELARVNLYERKQKFTVIFH